MRCDAMRPQHVARVTLFVQDSTSSSPDFVFSTHYHLTRSTSPSKLLQFLHRSALLSLASYTSMRHTLFESDLLRCNILTSYITTVSLSNTINGYINIFDSPFNICHIRANIVCVLSSSHREGDQQNLQICSF